jgi:predicted ATPase/transcriptional regulator with XRE-family HTH domain
MAFAESQTFGQLIRRSRLAAGFTQAELAERSGLSVRALGDLERGQRVPRKETIRCLVVALGLPVGESAALLAAARDSRRTSVSVPDAAPGTPDPSHAAPSPAAAARQLAPLIGLTPLIGREREEAAAIHMLAQKGVRLLTFTGPAGVGKTRLAAQVAATLKDTLASEVIFAGLTTLREAQRVLPAIAQPVDAREGGGTDLREALIASLRDRKLLLVLDNFEQVLPAAVDVLDLLQTCPRLQVLVTSRAALNVRGEQVFPVSPLDVPDPHHLPALDDLERYAAVALFIQRARAKKPAFALATAEDGRLVAAICRALDGLPLGIELAAARITLLPLRELHDRLRSQSPFPVLARSGARDAPERHQSLEAAIAWSYDLLDDDEQRLFRRLSIFAGGGTLEAVETVCGEPGSGSGASLLARLASLVDQSLVRQVEQEGESRYRLLMTLQAFGSQRLAQSGESGGVRRMHALYFLDLAVRAERGLESQQQLAWVDRLAREHDNLRAALQWTLDVGEILFGLRLAGALWRFWDIRSFLSEGLDWLDRLLARAPDAADPASRALQIKAALAASHLAGNHDEHVSARRYADLSLRLCRSAGDTAGAAAALDALGLAELRVRAFEDAQACFEESIALWRALDNPVGLSAAMHNLGRLKRDQGKFDEALVLYQESLAVARALGEDDMGLARRCNRIGDLALLMGETTQAERYLEESRELYERAGARLALAICVNNLARVAWNDGNLTLAIERYEMARALREEVGDTDGMARSLYGLGSVLREHGEADRAQRCLWESWGGFRQASQRGDRIAMSWVVEAFAVLACDRGEHEHAARLYGMAAALCQESFNQLDPVELTIRSRTQAALRAHLRDTGFEAAFASGAALSHEGIITQIDRYHDTIPLSAPGI